MVTISKNTNKGGIELAFPSKPADEVLAWIKSKGFGWSKYNKVWWRKFDNHTWNAVHEYFTLPVPELIPEETIPESKTDQATGEPTFHGITANEFILLDVTASLKSFARNEALKRNFILDQKDSLKASLVKKRLMLKSGAINEMGRTIRKKIIAEGDYNTGSYYSGYDKIIQAHWNKPAEQKTERPEDFITKDTSVLDVIRNIQKKHDLDTLILSNQIDIGVRIEKEHTNDFTEALKIAYVHLIEDPQYYTKAKPANWAEKELEKEAIPSFADYLKESREVYGWKNNEAIHEMYKIRLLKNAYEAEIDADNFGTGIKKNIADAEHGIAMNLSKVKIADETSFVYGKRKVAELMDRAKDEGKVIKAISQEPVKEEIKATITETDPVILNLSTDEAADMFQPFGLNEKQSLLIYELGKHSKKYGVAGIDKEIISPLIKESYIHDDTYRHTGMSVLTETGRILYDQGKQRYLRFHNNSDKDELEQVTEEINEMFEGATTAEVENVTPTNSNRFLKWTDIPEWVKYSIPVKPISFEREPDDKNLLRIVSPYADDDATRRSMLGINFEKGHIVTTDAHRLLHLTSKSKSVGNYCITNDCLKLTGKKTGSLIEDEPFPAWQQVIPWFGNAHKAEVDLLKLKTYCEIIIRSRQATAVVNTVYLVINDFEICINAEFLITICNTFFQLGETKAMFHASADTRPAVFTKVGVNDQKEEMLKSDWMLVMPLYNKLEPAQQEYFFRYDLATGEVIDHDKVRTVIDTSKTKDSTESLLPVSPAILSEIEKFTKKSTISIIEKTIFVQNRILRATNLSLSVEIRNIDLPDGFYRVENKVLLPYEIWAYAQTITENDIYKAPSVDDFPLPVSNDVAFEHTFTFGDEMIRMIADSKPFIAEDELRPVMCSIHYIKKNGMLYMGASNGNVLFLVHAPAIEDYTKEGFYSLPLSQLSRTICDFVDALQLPHQVKIHSEVRENMTIPRHVKIDVGNMTFYSITPETKAPDFFSVLPIENYKNRLVFSKKAFADASRKFRKGTYAFDGTNLVFSFGDESLTIEPISQSAIDKGYIEGAYVLIAPLSQTKMRGTIQHLNEFTEGDEIILWDIPEKGLKHIETKYSRKRLDEGTKSVQSFPVRNPKFKAGDYVKYEGGDVFKEHWSGIIREVRDLDTEYVYRIDAYAKNEDGNVLFDDAKNNEKYEVQLSSLSTESNFSKLKEQYEQERQANRTIKENTPIDEARAAEEKHDKIHSEFLRFTSDEDPKDRFKIYLVNGNEVRKDHIEFTMGGHGYVYDYVPKDEIWIDENLKDKPDDMEATIKHEVFEVHKMKDEGLDYESAHELANVMEEKVRKEPDKKLNPYIAFYKGKKHELYAESLYGAQKEAAMFFKIPLKDSYKVNVHIAEESDKKTKEDIAEVRLKKLMLLRKFISVSQHEALSELMMGEEGEAGWEIIDSLGGIIETMPHTYQTEKTDTDEKIVYLHYFNGGSDWYIVEKDKLPVQNQAFGYAILNGDSINAEWGYISILELIQNNVELDFYWTPKKFSEIIEKKEARKPGNVNLDLDVIDGGRAKMSRSEFLNNLHELDLWQEFEGRHYRKFLLSEKGSRAVTDLGIKESMRDVKKGGVDYLEAIISIPSINSSLEDEIEAAYQENTGTEVTLNKPEEKPLQKISLDADIIKLIDYLDSDASAKDKAKMWNEGVDDNDEKYEIAARSRIVKGTGHTLWQIASKAKPIIEVVSSGEENNIFWLGSTLKQFIKKDLKENGYELVELDPIIGNVIPKKWEKIVKEAYQSNAKPGIAQIADDIIDIYPYRQMRTYGMYNDRVLQTIGASKKKEKENMFYVMDQNGSIFMESGGSGWPSYYDEVKEKWGEKFADLAKKDGGVLERTEKQPEKETLADSFEKSKAIGINRILTTKYANDFELNKAIEELIDTKWHIPRDGWSAEELQFLKGYSGYGGLDQFGEITKGSLFEYFTPDQVIEKMWGLAYKYGYTNGPVLEPSCGIGPFFDRRFVSNTIEKHGYEINKYSAKIAKLLYPEAIINDGQETKYFEQLFIVQNYTVRSKVTPKYRLVIGNPPYGSVGGIYMGMGEKAYTHANNYIDYFILRGLDLLEKGGLLIFIIGAETAGGGVPFLDQNMNKVKEMINERGKLIDAYRLPSGVFSRTEVTSDIVVFRKR